MESRENIKKELLTKLNNEIKDIQIELKKCEFEQRNYFKIRNLKIIGNIANFLMPLAICSTIVIGGIKLVGGGYPFIKDNEKQYENYTKEFDSNEQMSTQKSYSDLTKNNIDVYSNWTLNEDGWYERIVEYYTFNSNEISEERILEIVYGKNKEIKELLGEPVVSIQTKQHVNPEEIKEEDYKYIQAFISGEDEEKFIVVKEATEANVFVTIFELLFIIALSYKGMDARNFSVTDSIQKLFEKYSKNNIKILKKQLGIKQENLNRLTR